MMEENKTNRKNAWTQSRNKLVCFNKLWSSRRLFHRGKQPRKWKVVESKVIYESLCSIVDLIRILKKCDLLCYAPINITSWVGVGGVLTVLNFWSLNPYPRDDHNCLNSHPIAFLVDHLPWGEVYFRGRW